MIEFCPNNECRMHLKIPDMPWYRKAGFYETKSFGRVQRYKCCHCNRTFSDQSFSIDYYSKRLIPYKELLEHLISASNCRAMSRYFGVNVDTINNKISRLARQAIGFMSNMSDCIRLKEELTADGFESYCVSKYFPNNINIVVGKRSQFVYFTDYVTIRRKGRMSEAQKKLRAALEENFKADPKGVKHSFIDILLDTIAFYRDLQLDAITIHTDEHKDYARAFKMPHIQGFVEMGNLIHRRYSSKMKRDKKNPLFPVNYMEREFRKDLINFARKTCCWGRNVSNTMYRLMVYIFHHNFIKKYRINQEKDDCTTHANMAGISQEIIEDAMDGFYRFRYFCKKRLNLFTTSWKIWFRAHVTPLKEGAEYVPAYVYD